MKNNNAKKVNAKNVNNAKAAEAKVEKKTTVYNGMYAEIKAAAQTPSAVVKSFYTAAMAVNGGAYSEYYKRLFGGTKNDFCSEWTPRVVAAFEAQTRSKRVSLFFVWNVVYRGGLREYIKTAKSVAKATAKADGKAVAALEALEGLGKAVKEAK